MKVKLYAVSGAFMVFNEIDVASLKALRVCPQVDSDGDSLSGFAQFGAFVMPEHAAVLLNYESSSLPDEASTSTVDCKDEEAEASGDICEEVWKKAEMICKGRKAKALKRKCISLGNADVYKVTKKEMQQQEVDRGDILLVYEELKKKDKKQVTKQETVQFYAESAYPVTKNVPEHELFPDCAMFLERKKVVHDLWLKGFFVSNGIKYGCHFLVYAGPPDEVHASWMLHCVGVNKCSPTHIDALRRVSSQTKKALLLAKTAPDSYAPQYTVVQRFTGQEDVLLSLVAKR